MLVNLLATCHEHSLMDTLIQSLDKDKVHNMYMYFGPASRP